MLARHAFQLAAAHAKHRPPEDQWAFLEEIDAPQWVDLTLEAALEGTEGDDPWFHQTHWHHETPLIHLSDVNPQQALNPGSCKSRSTESKLRSKRSASSKSPGEGSEDIAWNLRKTANAQGWPRSQAKRVQPLCLGSQVDPDLVRLCSLRESGVPKAAEVMHDVDEEELQGKRKVACTSKPLISSTDMVRFSVGQLEDGVVPDICLESVGSCSSLTQVRKKYLSTSENSEQESASGDEGLDHRQSVTSAIRECQTCPGICSNVQRMSTVGFPEVPVVGLDQNRVADYPDMASDLPADPEPECAGRECSRVPRQPIPDWSAQISRLRRSWGGALRVKQGDPQDLALCDAGKDSGAIRNAVLDDNRCRKSWGGALRLKQGNLEEPICKDGETGELDEEPTARVQKSLGGAMRVWEETTEPSAADGKGSGASNMDMAVVNKKKRNRWNKGAVLLKQEVVDESYEVRDSGTATGVSILDGILHNEEIQLGHNLNPENGSSGLSEVIHPGLENDDTSGIEMSCCSTVKLHAHDVTKNFERKFQDESVVYDCVTSCVLAEGGESVSSMSDVLSEHSKMASSGSIVEICNGTASMTVIDQRERSMKSRLSVQADVRGKCVKGRPPKGNKENLSLETGGKMRQSNHVTNKSHSAIDRQKQQQKAVLRMSMPVAQPGEALRRSGKSLGAEGPTRRSVSVGRTKPGSDAAMSKSGHLVTNHALSSKRVAASSNGQVCIRKSLSAAPPDAAKPLVSGVNRSLRTTGNAGLRTSLCQEKETDLAALIAEHNRKVRPVPQYEPRLHSLRDIREWERRTGQKYYSLPAVERAKVNQELSLLKGT